VDIKEIRRVCVCELNSSGSGYRPLVRSFEDGEHSNFE
jgi:hypothetical protein